MGKFYRIKKRLEDMRYWLVSHLVPSSELEAKTDEMVARLMKIRRSLWT